MSDKIIEILDSKIEFKENIIINAQDKKVIFISIYNKPQKDSVSMVEIKKS